jgi:hypothetical protein
LSADVAKGGVELRTKVCSNGEVTLLDANVYGKVGLMFSADGAGLSMSKEATIGGKFSIITKNLSGTSDVNIGGGIKGMEISGGLSVDRTGGQENLGIGDGFSIPRVGAGVQLGVDFNIESVTIETRQVDMSESPSLSAMQSKYLYR